MNILVQHSIAEGQLQFYIFMCFWQCRHLFLAVYFRLLFVSLSLIEQFLLNVFRLFCSTPARSDVFALLLFIDNAYRMLIALPDWRNKVDIDVGCSACCCCSLGGAVVCAGATTCMWLKIVCTVEKVKMAAKRMQLCRSYRPASPHPQNNRQQQHQPRACRCCCCCKLSCRCSCCYCNCILHSPWQRLLLFGT